MKRYFIAIHLKKALSPYLGKIKTHLPANLQSHLYHPDDLHLTLSFLGNCEDEPLKALNEDLKHTFKNFEPFDIQTQTFILLPDEKNPRVLAIACELSLSLKNLHDRVNKVCESSGFKTEENFLPHITLLRAKHLKPLSVKMPLMTLRAESVCLYASHVGLGDKRYCVVKNYTG